MLKFLPGPGTIEKKVSLGRKPGRPSGYSWSPKFEQKLSHDEALFPTTVLQVFLVSYFMYVCVLPAGRDRPRSERPRGNPSQAGPRQDQHGRLPAHAHRGGFLECFGARGQFQVRLCVRPSQQRSVCLRHFYSKSFVCVCDCAGL